MLLIFFKNCNHPTFYPYGSERLRRQLSLRAVFNEDGLKNFLKLGLMHEEGSILKRHGWMQGNVQTLGYNFSHICEKFINFFGRDY